MNPTTTRAPGLTVTLTAHEGPEGRLLLVSVTADETEADAPPASVAFVVDRSSSMSGEKLDAAKHGLARFVRSLRPEDRVALVAFDDEVSLLSPRAAPSEALARTVESIRVGGSTNLYGGWLAGAKALGPGGRVVLLSDGHANAGKFTDARELAREASLSYERFRVTTTTVGIGTGYDETLMAGMARAGGGGHYYAHDAESIVEILSRERYAVGAVAQSHVSLREKGKTVSLGHLWGGETKRVVLRVDDLRGDPPTLRATLAETGVTTTTALLVPETFGHSDEATLELALDGAKAAEAEAADVRNPRAATTAQATVRAALLRLLGHPLADVPLALAFRASLEATLVRLKTLEKDYDEAEATVHRKRSYQTMHNLAEPAKAYSSFGEDRETVDALAREVSVAYAPAGLDANALALLPAERWAAFPALPVGRRGKTLTVAFENPRDGFLIAEIEKATGHRVKSHPDAMTADAIRRALGRSA